ncbi:MAG: S-methyl-5-thioribose-1-phosphate isomerase [Candidatus Hydrogenedentes bacterium]|nr:S-methyl-5-thioribose-1-phosphate isomerase [Candidatus Hydrogenedentota bacterium]
MKPILWENGSLKIIDQTLLPSELKYLDIKTIEEAEDAIKSLRVRGAPAIGIFAGLALVAILKNMNLQNIMEAHRKMSEVSERLKKTRPTAVNLAWALDYIKKSAEQLKEDSVENFLLWIESTALEIYRKETEACRMIGIYGSSIINEGDGILTHCNAGALATCEYGTALAPIYLSKKEGKNVKVFVDETRPLFQGARLTAWELMQGDIQTVLICDNMAGVLMRERKINIVITGADRVARNGDTANKIGTYSLSILAKYHNIPFYVALPTSTFDLSVKDGSEIPIEYRNPEEVRKIGERYIAPKDVEVYNPAFDVTPGENITAFITEKGIIYPPFEENIVRTLKDR